MYEKIPKIILGKGCNLVFSDKGFRGRIFIPKFKNIVWKKNIATVDAGTNFQDFIEVSNKMEFSDLCNLSGIPGSLGGFIRGNAGAYGQAISDFIVGVEYLDEKGIVQKARKENCDFVYRGSVFKKNQNLFILNATFELKEKSDPKIALKKTKDLLKSRWQKLPSGRSGGCVFKNPIINGKKIAAGKLLQDLGAKNDQKGGIKIAEKHTNFFVNKNKATQKDLLELMQKWKQKVSEEYGIELEPEIFICDEFGKKINL